MGFENCKRVEVFVLEIKNMPIGIKGIMVWMPFYLLITGISRNNESCNILSLKKNNFKNSNWIVRIDLINLALSQSPKLHWKVKATNFYFTKNYLVALLQKDKI